ncbi:hypothetical protein D3C87_1387860 [compost metagenome]
MRMKMSVLFGLLMFLSLESFAAKKSYAAYSDYAVAGDCTDSDFEKLFLQNIISAGNNAKSVCENNTGKLCGITSLKSQYITRANHCVGIATASPIEK